MKKVSLVICLMGTLLLAACSKSGSNSPTVAVANCSTNGVYNPYGTQYPYNSQYPYGVPATTGCAGMPYGSQYGSQYGYGSNPCAVYNTGYQYWTPAMYGGQAVCVSN